VIEVNLIAVIDDTSEAVKPNSEPFACPTIATQSIYQSLEF